MDLFSLNPPHLGILKSQNFESTQPETALVEQLSRGLLGRGRRALPKFFAKPPRSRSFHDALVDRPIICSVKRRPPPNVPTSVCRGSRRRRDLVGAEAQPVLRLCWLELSHCAGVPEGLGSTGDALGLARSWWAGRVTLIGFGFRAARALPRLSFSLALGSGFPTAAAPDDPFRPLDASFVYRRGGL
jgi:hypothetical protein